MKELCSKVTAIGVLAGLIFMALTLPLLQALVYDNIYDEEKPKTNTDWLKSQIDNFLERLAEIWSDATQKQIEAYSDGGGVALGSPDFYYINDHYFLQPSAFNLSEFVDDVFWTIIFNNTGDGRWLGASGGNTTEEMQDAVGGAFDNTLEYDDAGDVMGVNMTFVNDTMDDRDDDTYVVSSECSAGDFVINITGDTIVCDTPAGGGDITGVYGDGIYIYNGSASGSPTLVLNETRLNITIDARDFDTTYTAGSNLSLTGTTFSLNVTSLMDYLDTIYKKIVDAFDGTWASLTGKPTHMSNFTDDITYTSGFNSTGDGRWLDNTDNQTLSYSGGNVTITGGNSVNISDVDTDTQLTEDEVEAYVFDEDNTDNLNLTGYNITANYYFLNDIGGACDLTINGSVCMNSSGVYIVG